MSAARAMRISPAYGDGACFRYRSEECRRTGTHRTKLTRMALQLPIYMDNHATTRTDPRVVAAMLPYFTEQFGNPASKMHVFGNVAEQAVKQARAEVAAII